MWVEHVSGSPWVQWMPQSWTPRARIFNRRNVAGHTHTHTPLANCGKTTVIHQQLEGNATQQNTKDKYTVIRRRVYYFSNVFAPACEVYFSVFCAKTFVSNENVLIFLLLQGIRHTRRKVRARKVRILHTEQTPQRMEASTTHVVILRTLWSYISVVSRPIAVIWCVVLLLLLLCLRS